jgi:hypothetical protein
VTSSSLYRAILPCGASFSRLSIRPVIYLNFVGTPWTKLGGYVRIRLPLTLNVLGLFDPHIIKSVEWVVQKLWILGTMF